MPERRDETAKILEILEIFRNPGDQPKKSPKTRKPEKRSDF